MATVEIIMPKMGESIMEATVLKWLKNEGDRVEMDESLLEIATDKVDSEVPSTEEGVLTKKLCEEGDVVEVGKPVALMEIEGEAEIADSAGTVATIVETKTTEVAVAAPTIKKSVKSGASRFYSPLVLNIAKQESVSVEELESIEGTGKNGRVTKKNILAYVKTRKGAPATGNDIATSSVRPEAYRSNGVEIVEMDRMRKLIADHMVRSKHEAPHVTSFVEADVTNLVLWREKVKAGFQKTHGQKITFTPLFVEAVVRAIKDYPGINVSVDGHKIIYKKDINVGVATALPSGNLIVPVIKNADHKSLLGLVQATNDLVAKARNNQLAPTDIQDGTFTLTNVGTFGNLSGTPIINQPQVAILSVGSIIKKPAVLETPQGDVIAIRRMMFLSLSYDHRVVDGFLGGSFLRRVGDYLEAFDKNRNV